MLMHVSSHFELPSLFWWVELRTAQVQHEPCVDGNAGGRHSEGEFVGGAYVVAPRICPAKLLDDGLHFSRGTGYHQIHYMYNLYS